ncbi:MAG: hypothetical protein AB1705_04590 [Verrucomicrobiota bacterium]
MSANFVPLFPQLPARPGGPDGFAHLKIHPVDQQGETSLSKVQPPAASPPHGEARVTLLREGERVTGIRVECRCGEVVLLDCVY